VDQDIRFFVKRYIDAGWAVMPIAPGKKRPVENGWQKKAEKKGYKPEDFGPQDNIGVALGEPSDWRCDVDLDSQEGIQAAKFLLPDTGLIHGRAGKPASHWWYRSPGLSVYLNFKDPTDKSALVELRAVSSHQTVIPPGVHASGERIEWEKDGEPLELEPEVLKKAVAHVAIAALLARHWPREGGARHELALIVGGFMGKAMPDDPSMAYRILEVAFRIAGDEEWKDRARAARETIAKAQKDEEGKKVTGVPRFIKEFPNGGKIADCILEWLGVKAEGVSAGRIEELNERFFKVPYGSDVVVAEPGGMIDGTVRFWSFENFDKLFCHEKVTVGKQTVGMGRYWREHEQARRFERFLYAPPGSKMLPLKADDFNGWKGFSVEPLAGSWNKNKEHIRAVICNGNDDVFEWVMDWCADLFQAPGRPAMTAIVLLGGQGAGKGHFVDKMLGGCFDRQHYVHIIDRKAVFGDFNDALSGRVLTFIDEATWGGDKRDAGIIKGLVTEPTISISRKFLPRVTEENMQHVLLASNEEWPVGIDRDDRRFCVLQVSGKYANNQSYFGPLLEELERGGRAAMLAELLARPVTRNLKQPPATDARTRLKRASFQADVAWWFDKLEEGVALPGQNGWQQEVGKDELYEDYVERLSKTGQHRKKMPSELGAFMRKMVPAIGEKRTRPDYKRKWVLPTLAECRENFEAYMKETYAWPDEQGAHVQGRDEEEL
jgi:hypothetical protein